MEREKTIDVLNTLITTNNNRIKAYEFASKEIDEQELKTFFVQYTATSQKCKQELLTEVNKLGGKIAEIPTNSEELFDMWIDVIKVAITANDRKAILKSCEYGEDIVVNTYFKALRNNMNNITAEQQIMINAQHDLIKADYNKMKSMRDKLAYTQIKYDISLAQSTVKHSWF
jgi:uncharacterized protein (TIGR02284 family)